MEPNLSNELIASLWVAGAVVFFIGLFLRDKLILIAAVALFAVAIFGGITP